MGIYARIGREEFVMNLPRVRTEDRGIQTEDRRVQTKTEGLERMTERFENILFRRETRELAWVAIRNEVLLTLPTKDFGRGSVPWLRSLKRKSLPELVGKNF